jgi:hypothetical protein
MPEQTDNAETPEKGQREPGGSRTVRRWRERRGGSVTP